MASQPPVKGPLGVNGFTSRLPIPFVNGTPVDYRQMTIDQLRLFINFVYKCQFKNDLPISKEQNRNQALPQWWPQQVSFEKSLKVREVLQGPRGSSEQKKALVSLVYDCYSYHASLSFLSIGQDLANAGDNKPMWIDRTNSDNLWKLVGFGGRTLVVVDALSVTYDSTNGPKLRERSSTTTEKEGADFNFPDSNSPRTPKPLVHSRAKKPKVKKRSAKKTKEKQKRKLYEIEDDDEPNKEPVACKYCSKSFKIPEFCDDHESQCTKGPKSNVTIQSFMGALGMLDRAEVELRPSETSTLRTSPVSSVSSGRAVRKLPKRNHLLSVIKNHPLPITSVRGQQLITELGEKATPTYPPSYERDCRSRTGQRPVADKDYPNVMKKAIAKDAINPHVYSYGRSQRLDRYQEIVLGVSKSTFPALNKLKIPRLVLTRMKPMYNTIDVSSCTKKSHLERQFRAAIELPRVRMVDISKHMTPEVAKYWKKDVKAVIEKKNMTPEVAQHSKKKENAVVERKNMTPEVAQYSKKKENAVIERKKMTPGVAKYSKKEKSDAMERKKVTSEAATSSKKDKVVMDRKIAKAPSSSSPGDADSILSDSSCSSSSSGSLFVPVAKKMKSDASHKTKKKYLVKNA